MPDPAVSLYEQDFYAWANEQAALLRAGKLTTADIEHIAEEIESMGRGEMRELVSCLAVLLAHLLKWRFQPESRGKSWRLTIDEQRGQIRRHLRDNPSLQNRLNEAMRDGYGDATIAAARETDFDKADFSAACPWSFEQIMADDFWPGDTAH